VVSYALVTLSRILYEWNDLAAALDCAQEALALARPWGVVDSLAGGYISLIMVQIARREFDRAFESIQEMKRLYGTPGPYPRRPVALEALARLVMNDVTGAARCTADLVPHTDEEWRMENLISVYVAQYRQGSRASLDDVLGFLARTLPIVEAADTKIGMVQMLALQAVALQVLGRVEEARAVLTRALAMAEPEGYVRIFIDEGAPMGELLAAVLATQRPRRGAEAQRMAAYASRLLAALAGNPPEERPAAPPSAVLVEPLSARELEVLRLLATTLSTPEIARELVVSANTVRSHVKCIYGKLNAHGRIEALQRARELGLLP
jgi:LuxR family maltose regulon positive regulatory protein